MKHLLLILFLFALSPLMAQNAEYYFHSGAQTYIGGNNNGAKSILKEGLSKYPNHPKLNELNDKIKEEEQDDKDQENQDKEDQEKKDQEKEGEDGEKKEEKEGEEKEGEDGEEKKEEEGKEGEKSEEEKKKEQEKQEGKEQDENKDGEKDTEKQPPSTSDKLKEMNISEEKAKMILEALKNNEIQYIQQNRRKATKRKNKDKPDW